MLGLVNFYRKHAVTDKDLEEEIAYLESNTKIRFMKAKLNQHALYERIDTYKSLYTKGITSNKARKNFSIWFNEFVRIVLN